MAEHDPERDDDGAPEGGGPGEGPAAGDAGARARATQGPAGDLVADVLGRVLRRGREEMGKAAKWGRERLTLRQLRSDRDRMYQKLGKEARHLLEGGEIEHPGLRRGVERITELESRILALEDLLRGRGVDVDEPEAPPEGGAG
jgi:hypothetical protein